MNGSEVFQNDKITSVPFIFSITVQRGFVILFRIHRKNHSYWTKNSQIIIEALFRLIKWSNFALNLFFAQSLKNNQATFTNGIWKNERYGGFWVEKTYERYLKWTVAGWTVAGSRCISKNLKTLVREYPSILFHLRFKLYMTPSAFLKNWSYVNYPFLFESSKQSRQSNHNGEI